MDSVATIRFSHLGKRERGCTKVRRDDGGIGELSTAYSREEIWSRTFWGFLVWLHGIVICKKAVHLNVAAVRGRVGILKQKMEDGG